MAIVLPKFSRRHSPVSAPNGGPTVNLSLDREDATYGGGCEMVVQWRLGRIRDHAIDRAELSILWHTVGKGDEELHVHDFFGVPHFNIVEDRLETFRTELPVAPLSYVGKLITIRWCARLRILWDRNDIVTEQPFYLTSATPADASVDDVAVVNGSAAVGRRASGLPR